MKMRKRFDQLQVGDFLFVIYQNSLFVEKIREYKHGQIRTQWGMYDTSHVPSYTSLKLEDLNMFTSLRSALIFTIREHRYLTELVVYNLKEKVHVSLHKTELKMYMMVDKSLLVSKFEL